MSKEPWDADDSHIESGSFQQWVNQIAEQKDVKEQDVISQVMSSYWILDELVGLMEESNEGEHGIFQSDPATTSPKPPSAEETPTMPDGNSDETAPDYDAIQKILATVQRLESDLQTASEPTDRTQPTDHSDSKRLEIQLQQLATELERIDQKVTITSTNAANAITSLASDVDTLAESIDSKSEEAELIALSEELAEIETELDDRQETVQSLATELEDVGTAIDTKADEEALVDLADNITSVRQELKSDQDELRSRFQTEFENLKEILEYLVTSNQQLETELTNLLERYEQDVSRLLKHEQEQARLTSITRTAIDLGVERARCDNCDAKIKVAHLTTPRCPNCEQLFKTIKQERGWIRKHNLLITADSQEEFASKPDSKPENTLETSTRNEDPGSVTTELDDIELDFNDEE